MILVENIYYQYENGNKVLKNVNFNINKGEFVAIIGQNGAGKTTLLKHFNGLLSPSSGRVLVCGMDISRTKTSVLSKHIGFLFQNPDHQIFCATVYEEIAFGLKNIGLEPAQVDIMVKDAAEKVGLLPYLDCVPFSLSRGQRQRVALASVLSMGSDILVLDEPTTGQDYQEGLEIMEIIKDLNQNGKTIIIVTHDMEIVASYAKRVIVMQNGTVLEDGETSAVLKKTEILEQSSLRPPQLYMLAKEFHCKGLFNNVRTVEDMFNEIKLYLEGDKNECSS